MDEKMQEQTIENLLFCKKTNNKKMFFEVLDTLTSEEIDEIKKRLKEKELEQTF